MSTQSQSKSDSEVARVEAVIASIRNHQPTAKKTLADRFETVARRSDFVVLIIILVMGLGYVRLHTVSTAVDISLQHSLCHEG